MMINKPSLSLPSSFNPRSHSSFLVPTFLEQCFLCGQKLMLYKEIYMYNDKAFCNEECRLRLMSVKEKNLTMKETCSLASLKPTSASSSSSASRGRKRNRNQHGRN